MEHPPSSVVVFTLGCLGALVPEIARLYGKRWRIRSGTFPPLYFILSGLYSLVGGVVAVYLPAVNGLAAIYAGAAWPSMFSTLIHHRRQSARSRRLHREHPLDVRLRSDQVRRSRPFIDLVRDHADLLFW